MLDDETTEIEDYWNKVHMVDFFFIFWYEVLTQATSCVNILAPSSEKSDSSNENRIDFAVESEMIVLHNRNQSYFDKNRILT